VSFVHIFNCICVLGTEVGTVLTAVTANDVDTNPALTYGFSTDSDSETGINEAEDTGLGVFSIDRFSGKITLVQCLDFESQREYHLRVTASDTAHTARTVLTIRVTDVNDNPPIFMQSSYQASLPGEYHVVFISTVFCSSNFSYSGWSHFCNWTLLPLLIYFSLWSYLSNISVSS
jgi:protocadherin-16/23